MSGKPIHVAAAGLCCSLGYHLEAAVWAMRANMDHFQESDFYCRQGEPINVARLPEEIYGAARLQRMIDYAVRDCVGTFGNDAGLFDPARTELILLSPGAHRPQPDVEEWRVMALAALASASSTVEGPLPTQVHGFTLLQGGRARLGDALAHVSQRLDDGAEQVLLIAADSYLNARDINAGLSAERLFVTGNSNGFVPGEAAAALVLRRARPGQSGVQILGLGMAEEHGRPDGSVPSRGQGLTAAVRSACAAAGIAPSALSFRASDQNGEQFFAREAANAMARVMSGGPRLAHVTIADKIGEVGAATGPSLLAWLVRDLADPSFSPGPTGVIHLADDEGERCAIVVGHFGDT